MKAAATRFAENLGRYDALVATNPDIKRRGATLPYTSLNGNMFSFLTKDGTLMLRLTASDRQAFMKKYKTPVVRLHGSLMAEYVEIPDALLVRQEEIKKVFDASYRYVGSLQPKPTTRKGKKTSAPRQSLRRPRTRTVRRRRGGVNE